MTSVANALAAIDAADQTVLTAVAPASCSPANPDGVLAGEAIVVKDCIGVPGFKTTAASPVLSEYQKMPGTGINRLLGEGAVVVGIATMHELAFGVSGKNDWAGTPTNPVAPDRLPGGSSSGCAVAVASGLVDVAIATDTGGSARIPAACCGVVGFRPSTGRYPNDGLITLSHTRDTIGIIAQTLQDVVRFDAVLAQRPSRHEVRAIEVERIAIPTEATIAGLETEVAAAFRDWVEDCSDRGVIFIEVELAPLLELDDAASFPIALRETILSFTSLAQEVDLSYGAFVDRVASKDVQELLLQQTPTETEYLHARDVVLPQMRAWYLEVLTNADVLALPTMPVLPPNLHNFESMPLHNDTVPTFPTMARFTSAASLAGVPSISVPLPSSNGRVSILLEGRRNDDLGLLARVRSLFPDRWQSNNGASQ